MGKTLIINGMHCDACKILIRMEIDDVGLSDKIKDINLTSGNNKGFVDLQNVSEEEVEKIIEAIDALGEYKVVE